MIRTQIYLPKDLYQEVNLMAEKENKSKASIIREALEEKLTRKKATTGKTLLEIAQIAKEKQWKGPKDLSTNLDKYLYE